MADTDPISLTGSEVMIHTFPLPGEAKVLVLIEANRHVTHVLSLPAQAARSLVVGLLDALDLVDPAQGTEDLAALEGSEDDDERA